MWLSKGDDDWLAEDETPAKTPSVPVPMGSAAPPFHEIDLTSNPALEPLHTLPEAPACKIRMLLFDIPTNKSIDITDGVSYFVIKLPSVKHLSTIQASGVCGISQYCEKALNIALATSSFVVLIFSVIGTHTFDGYALLNRPVGDGDSSAFNPSGYAPGLNPRPAKVQFIRRGLIPFEQVAHIRDNTGLQGRPVSSARDGVLLGTAAGRTLCRAIDKRAFKDDPVHYSDTRYSPRVMTGSKSMSVQRIKKEEASFVSMTYDEYRTWYTDSRKPEDSAPTMRHVVDG